MSLTLAHHRLGRKLLIPKISGNQFNPDQERPCSSLNRIQQLFIFIMTVHLSKSRVASSLFIIIPPRGGGGNPIKKIYTDINVEGLLMQTTPPPCSNCATAAALLIYLCCG